MTGSEANIVMYYDVLAEALYVTVWNNTSGVTTFTFLGNATFPGGTIPRAASMRMICVLLADGISAYIQRIGTDATPVYLDSFSTFSGPVPAWDPRADIWGGGVWRPCAAILTFGTATTQTVTAFSAGSCGGVGIRDIKLVTDTDAYPAYFSSSFTETTISMSATLLSPKGLGQNAVVIYDLAQPAVRPTIVALIWVKRLGSGSVVIHNQPGTYNDLAAHLVKVERDRWWMFTSTWGNGFGSPLQILWRDVSDVFAAGGTTLVAVDGWSLVNLSVYPDGQYDPFLFKIRNGSYVMCYAATPDTNFPNSPMVVACDLLSGSNWVNVGSGKVGEEGAVVIPTGDSVYLTGARPTNFSYYKIASQSVTAAPSFEFKGEANVVTSGGVDTRPWGNVFRLASDPDTLFLITFDDTRAEGVYFTWGKFQLFVAP